MTMEAFLTRRQIATLTAVTERILPSDDGPGAKEAGVMDYLRRVFAQPFFGQRRQLYASGLDLLQSVARELYGSDFADCTPEEQDRVLGELKKVPHRIALRFLVSLIDLTLAGFLCDPQYGGNRDRVGWEYLDFERRTAPPEPEPATTTAGEG